MARAAAQQVLAGIIVGNFSESSDSDDEDQRLIRQPFTIRQISEKILYQQTRLNREVFNFVLDLLTRYLTPNTRKGRYQHLTPMQKLYVALQFYATGSYQWLVGSSVGMSQFEFIIFPDAEEYPAVKQNFYRLGITRHGRGFPHVLGAIDCTHARIQAPTNRPEQYLNRHIYHSINVQLIVGPDLIIYNVFAEYPGSNHDSYIWRNSAVRDGLANGNFGEGWLVGDSGYPLEPWIMTPVGQVNTPAELLYNSVHISTRNPVERTNGVLKSRWYVLDSPLKYSPRKALTIYKNIHYLHDDFPCQEPPNPNYANIRQNLIERHFT
ncbi:hypothetical protein Zmor_006235 [Zophobas morio]|uniref:DDE Tnp4 domain-containing protein n=1 Tax=Zophobas morio TaxID=2755281 RepID=A0AA38IX08_9CUCU|nr:hypothetical protein Zmor_006235 [Zophobas morio]